MNDSNDWVTNPSVSQFIFNSLLSTELKGDLMELSAGRALEIIFDDRSAWFLARNSDVFKELSGVAMTKLCPAHLLL